MKCPRCGSGRQAKQRLNWMYRYTCLECSNSWTDQIEAIPGRDVHNPVTGETYYQPGQEEK